MYLKCKKCHGMGFMIGDGAMNLMDTCNECYGCGIQDIKIDNVKFLPENDYIVDFSDKNFHPNIDSYEKNNSKNVEKAYDVISEERKRGRPRKNKQ